MEPGRACHHHTARKKKTVMYYGTEYWKTYRNKLSLACTRSKALFLNLFQNLSFDVAKCNLGKVKPAPMWSFGFVLKVTSSVE